MKTIVIQLLKTMILPEDEYYEKRYSGYAMEDYAPYGVYNYYKLGKLKLVPKSKYLMPEN